MRVQRWWTGCMLVLVLASGARHGAAQEPLRTVPMRVHSDSPLAPQPDRSQSPLDRLVSVTLRDVTLQSAITTIAKAADVEIVYGSSVVPLQHLVSLYAKNMSVRDALLAVLRGTGATVKVSSKGKITLVKDTSAGETDSQQGRAVRGKITDATTGRPIPGGRAAIKGDPGYVAVANDSGDYAIRNLSPGTYIVVVRALGYAVRTRSVTVAADADVAVDFTLSPSSTFLQEVVTTGATDRRRSEVGNSIAVINADSVVRTMPIRDVTDLLKGRVPGADVLASGGEVGSASRIRIRGVSSLENSNDPIVIVDGVRIDASTTKGIDGNPPAIQNFTNYPPALTRLNNLDPATIESVEVLRGPSAAALYGSDAANGVILIKTKKGTPGPARWSVSGSRGWSRLPEATYPESYYGWGTSLVNPSGPCALVVAPFGGSTVASGQCTQDSVTHFDPLNNPVTSPFSGGTESHANAQVSGGSQQLRYFVSGSYDNQIGILKMPAIYADSLELYRHTTSIPDWQERPNALQSVGVTNTMTSQINDKTVLTLSTAYTHNLHRSAPQGTQSFINGGVQGGAKPYMNGGWSQISPSTDFSTLNTDNADDLLGTLHGEAQPTSWWALRGTVGVDHANQTTQTLTRAGDFPAAPLPGVVTPNSGSKSRYDNATTMTTVDLGTNASASLPGDLVWRTSVGGQAVRDTRSSLFASGTTLLPGSDQINKASTRDGGEAVNATATVGAYVEESLGWLNRRFLTMALRQDYGSTFGTDTKNPLYPKWSASWVLSQEPMFKGVMDRLPLSNVRLRAAFGHAGIQPATQARYRTYSLQNVYLNGATSTSNVAVINTLGNESLVPERSVEFEGGIDVGFWDDRLLIEGTLYSKRTENMLVNIPIPPSFGLGNRDENIGAVRNSGQELTVTARPIDGRSVTWSTMIGASGNRNKLVSLNAQGVPISGVNYHLGYPLFGIWGKAVTGYGDRNGDGFIEPNEVQMTDSTVYLGQNIPKVSLTFNNTLSFLSGRLTLNAMVDYAGGMTQRDQTLISLAQLGYAQGNFDPNATTTEQLLSLYKAASSLGLQTVSWWRLESLALSLMLPTRLAQRVGAHSASLSLMGRNLGLWTNYNGQDPEVNTQLVGDTQTDDGSIPQTRDWLLRIDLGF